MDGNNKVQKLAAKIKYDKVNLIKEQRSNGPRIAHILSKVQGQ